MNEVSLNLNERTKNVPIFSLVNQLLKKYYESNPIEKKESKSLLNDTYYLLSELFDIVGCKYSEETRLLIANYLYRIKGSPKVIYEMFRILFGENRDFISSDNTTIPNYSIDYKYNVRGFNDIYGVDDLECKKFIEGDKVKLPSSSGCSTSGCSIDIYVYSSDPISLNYPLILDDRASLIPSISNDDINGIVSYVQDYNNKLPEIVEYLSEKPEWANGCTILDDSTCTKINADITVSWTDYTSNSETQNKLYYSNDIENGCLEEISISCKCTILNITEEKLSKYTTGCVVSSSISNSDFSDGSYVKTTKTVYNTSGCKYNEVYYTIGSCFENPKIRVESYTKTVTNKGCSLDLSDALKNPDKYSVSSSIYNESQINEYELKYSDLFSLCIDNRRKLQEGEEETVVSFEVYDDGYLKEKETIQTAYNWHLEENTVTVKDARDDSEISENKEYVLRKTPIEIKRKYTFEKPEKKDLISSAYLLQKFEEIDGNQTFKRFYDEISFSCIKLCKDLIVKKKGDEGYYLSESYFDKAFTVEENNKPYTGDFSFRIISNISKDDTEKSLEAQKIYWEPVESGSNIKNSFNFNKIKDNDNENYCCEVKKLDDTNITSNNVVLKNFIRPHIEGRLLLEENKCFTSKVINNIVSLPFTHVDSRFIQVILSFITVLDRTHFVNITNELFKDLLYETNNFLSDDSNLDLKNNSSIKVETVAYNLDSNIKLKSGSTLRQTNNIIPNKYISEGKLIWKSQY